MYEGGTEPEASCFRLEEGNQGPSTNSFYKKFFFNTFTKTAKTTALCVVAGGGAPFHCGWGAPPRGSVDSSLG